MSHEDVRERGFKERTRVEDARAALAERVSPHGRSETVPIEAADGRVTAAEIVAERNVPHYDRAAMDGYAVQADETHRASPRSPVQLSLTTTVGDGGAEPVHTGSPLPEGADAVVKLEETTERDEILDVFDAVAAGENVGEVGEDVAAGTSLYDPGSVLRPSDLGLLKSLGHESVDVATKPEVAVIPTGEELVQSEPAPGEIIETNGLTVSRLVQRWGGTPRYRSVVTDDRDALGAALERDLDADLIATTGGSSVGARDLLPTLIRDRGDVFVHGVALRPGHPVALGEIADTPVLALPGYPVACLVNAVQFLRPAMKWLMGTDLPDHPTVRAQLDQKLRSEPGIRTFARVALRESPDGPVADPIRASGAGVLSSVTRADGWVVVPEPDEGLPAGESVAVERWEWSP